MTLRSVLVAAALFALAPAGMLYAQDEGHDGNKPAPTVHMPDGSREAVGPVIGRAVQRPAPAPARSAPAAPPPRPRGEQAAAAPAAAAPAPDAQRRQNGGRDRGDNPAVGRAVPRGGEVRPAPRPAPAPQRQGGRVVERPRVRGGTNVYIAPRSYYYYPRRYYPYGYGAFGLGYFYYDPYTWYPPAYYPDNYGGYYDGGRWPGGFFEGELRIDVSPSFAEVYVDGYFAGRVDDFDGVFQSLRLEEGAHHIQIAAPGFAPLDFDVRIEPGRKITYRGGLQPYRP